MGSLGGFVLYMVFLISLSAGRALDKTAAACLGARAGDPEWDWFVSGLLGLVFVVGLYHVRKAARASPLGERKSPSRLAAGLFVAASACYAFGAAFDVQTMANRLSAPQVPPSLKAWLVAVMAVNLAAWVGWTLCSLRDWRTAR